jgi:antitoxin (DNA-binding transcriptional repressor) of toxin-antitoxin stability system
MAEQGAVHEARTSRVIDRDEDGDEVVICRARKPVMKIIPLTAHTHRKGRGSPRGVTRLVDDRDPAETNAVVAADLEP